MPFCKSTALTINAIIDDLNRRAAEIELSASTKNHEYTAKAALYVAAEALKHCAEDYANWQLSGIDSSTAPITAQSIVADLKKRAAKMTAAMNKPDCNYGSRVALLVTAEALNRAAQSYNS